MKKTNKKALGAVSALAVLAAGTAHAASDIGKVFDHSSSAAITDGDHGCGGEGGCGGDEGGMDSKKKPQKKREEKKADDHKADDKKGDEKKDAPKPAEDKKAD